MGSQRGEHQQSEQAFHIVTDTRSLMLQLAAQRSLPLVHRRDSSMSPGRSTNAHRNSLCSTVLVAAVETDHE
jgi:hypothetical protein